MQFLPYCLRFHDYSINPLQKNIPVIVIDGQEQFPTWV